MGALFAGRSHCPVLVQQLFLAERDMKNCGQEMQPPHMRVSTIMWASSELAMVRSTGLTVGY